MKSIKGINLKNKIVLLRADLNVTLDPTGKIIDNIRIKSLLPTLEYLLKKDIKEIIIVSHLGRPIIRPKEKIQNIITGNKGLLLKPIANELALLLGNKKYIARSYFMPGFELPFYKITDKISLMENVRFAAGEEINDHKFAKELSKLADLYVNDAFGNAHRNHASMVGVTSFLPSCAGLLMEKEVKNLSNLLKKPPKPFVLILGGAKTSEKILILKNLIKKVDKILLGGVTANTFLAARGVDVKTSYYDKDSIELANELYMSAPGKFCLPDDLVWRGRTAADIGGKTIKIYEGIIKKAKTIFYNGTMGLTSMGSFTYAHGTHSIIKAIADSAAEEKIICGGDTIAEVDKIKMNKRMTFISTGGGAALQFLAGCKLPAINALNKNEEGKNVCKSERIIDQGQE